VIEVAPEITPYAGAHSSPDSTSVFIKIEVLHNVILGVIGYTAEYMSVIFRSRMLIQRGGAHSKALLSRQCPCGTSPSFRGLFTPGLIRSYPGTTSLASASIYIYPQAGSSFLKQLAHSLLRQGFRHQVYISASHGPAPLTVGTMVREFFEETQVPILYINMDTVIPKLSLDARQRERLLYGAHAMTSRLEDLPPKGDYVSAITQAPPEIPENEGLKELGKLSLTLGFWVPHSMARGGAAPQPTTAAKRNTWGREGTDLICTLVREMKFPKPCTPSRSTTGSPRNGSSPLPAKSSEIALDSKRHSRNISSPQPLQRKRGLPYCTLSRFRVGSKYGLFRNHHHLTRQT